MFKRIFEKLACKHKWEVHFRQKTFESEYAKMPHTIVDTLICTECGKIKRVRV